MPRNGRIRMVGKREAREAQERVDELKELERALRRERRESPDAGATCSNGRLIWGSSASGRQAA
jgi:hypothetical protein